MCLHRPCLLQKLPRHLPHCPASQIRDSARTLSLFGEGEVDSGESLLSAEPWNASPGPRACYSSAQLCPATEPRVFMCDSKAHVRSSSQTNLEWSAAGQKKLAQAGTFKVHAEKSRSNKPSLNTWDSTRPGAIY